MFLIILSIKGFEGNLNAYTPFIQESENRQEDCGLELIMAAMEEKCGFYAIRGISKTLPLKLNFRIDICCITISFAYVNCDNI